MFLTYSELISIPDFLDRFKYCQLNSTVGQDTFGFDRYLNQNLYRSQRWRKLRNEIIIRDNACDLAHNTHPIPKKVLIHHLNPITEHDIMNESSAIYDPENLVCVSHDTHNAIHYGTDVLLPKGEITRQPNDTCPWRQ